MIGLKQAMLGVVASGTLLLFGAQEGVYAADQNRWAGPYVGGHVGYAFGDSDYFVPGTGFNVDLDPDGFLGGVHIGYNWQINDFVLGVVSDLDFADINDSTVAAGFFPAPGKVEVDVNFTHSTRGKFGITWGDFLLYGTAGVAMANIDHEVTNTVTGISANYGDRLLYGLTVGAGAEWAFTDNISAYAEWRWTDLSDDTFGFVAAPPVVFTHDLDLTYHQVQIGVSWKFDSPFGL